jgi:hypothetical protein
MDATPTSLTPLDAARHLESLVALLWEVRSHLSNAPWKRARKRSRRELKRLAGALSELEASVLRGAASFDGAVLGGLHTLLDDALSHPPATKQELKHLRQSLKRCRGALSMASAA